MDVAQPDQHDQPRRALGGPFRQFTDTTWRAACNALVGPRLEVEPGERCQRCLDYFARRSDDD